MTQMYTNAFWLLNPIRKAKHHFCVQVQSETMIAIISIIFIILIIFHVITAIFDIIFGIKNNEYNRNGKIQ
jgi:flagellar biosynthesis protein FlhB